MRVITACDVIPGAGRQGLRLLARPAPAALGVPPRTARTRPARRARRHPEGADPQRVARRVSAHAAMIKLGGADRLNRGVPGTTCFSYASRARNPAVNRPFGTGLAAGGAQTVLGPG